MPDPGISKLFANLNGSSPRVRGTGPPSCCWKRQMRFIPACAGNSISWQCGNTTGAVHPRVCGEQHLQSFQVHDRRGSSPRVRGTVLEMKAFTALSRFIPACAGNRASRRRLVMTRSVHPRVCGEQMMEFTEISIAGGSSPRVRGTGLGRARRTPRCRFIPACAGNRSAA